MKDLRQSTSAIRVRPCFRFSPNLWQPVAVPTYRGASIWFPNLLPLGRTEAESEVDSVANSRFATLPGLSLCSLENGKSDMKCVGFNAAIC